MLTAREIIGYVKKALAKSSVGISTPFLPSVKALTVVSFFMPKNQFMVGLFRALRRAVPRSGSTNLFKPATLFGLVPIGGSSQNHPEDNVMCKELIANPANWVSISNDSTTTNSQLIAKAFHKRHHHVIEKLNGLECSAEFNATNFRAVEYTDGKGEKRPAYEMTKDGFIFLVMGFTGKKAAHIKEAYINAFNVMSDQLTGNTKQLAAIDPEEEMIELPKQFVKMLYKRLHEATVAHASVVAQYNEMLGVQASYRDKVARSQEAFTRLEAFNELLSVKKI